MLGGVGQVCNATSLGSYTGLAQCLAMEGFKYNIKLNVVSQADLPMESMSAKRREATAAPITYLCHESCKASAGIYKVDGGHVQSLRWQSDEGFVVFDASAGWTALDS